MNTSPVRGLTIAGVLAAALSLAACGVVVREDDRGNEKRVDIRSPFGSVTVNTGAEPAETGLPIYPGARPLRNGDEPDHANVTVGNSWFGVTVAAAKFERTTSPRRFSRSTASTCSSTAT